MSIQVSELATPRDEEVAKHAARFRDGYAPTGTESLWGILRVYIDDLQAACAADEFERASNILEAIEGLGQYITERIVEAQRES